MLLESILFFIITVMIILYLLPTPVNSDFLEHPKTDEIIELYVN